MATLPPWIADLDEQDLTFVKRFLLASGSLKEVAAQYGVSYPTVRLRLDRLIQKIRLSDTTEADPYVALVKRLAVDDKRESRWPGLVLPLLTFLQSLLLVLNIIDTGSVSQNVLTVLVTLLTGNIPTLVLLAIYWAVREKRRVRDQIDKMKIDEL